MEPHEVPAHTRDFECFGHEIYEGYGCGWVMGDRRESGCHDRQPVNVGTGVEEPWEDDQPSRRRVEQDGEACQHVKSGEEMSFGGNFRNLSLEGGREPSASGGRVVNGRNRSEGIETVINGGSAGGEGLSVSVGSKPNPLVQSRRYGRRKSCPGLGGTLPRCSPQLPPPPLHSRTTRGVYKVGSAKEKRTPQDGLASMQLIAPVLVLLALTVVPAQAQNIVPHYMWDVSLTEPLLSDQVGAITSIAMPHYACTKKPNVPYCPGCKEFRGVDCDPTSPTAACDSCNAGCDSFDMGAGAFPATCLPRLQALEDQASPMATYFHHIYETSTNGTASTSTIVGPDDAKAPTGKFTHAVSVLWGYLDVYGLWQQCDCREKIGAGCVCETSGDYGLVRFRVTGDVLEELRTVEITGTFKQIKAALLNMSFTGLHQYNDLRVRHLKLSPGSTKKQPFFTAAYRGPFMGALSVDLGAPADFTQLIHVIADNNAPTVTDPQKGWSRGCTTPAPCDTVYSLFEYSGPNYHFGQFWRWEGTSDPLMIRGIEVADSDVDEQCLYDQFSNTLFLENPQKAYFCGKLDFRARALIGRLSLNVRDELSFYDTARSSVGFTAVTNFVQSAVRAVYYQVELATLISSGESTVDKINTQYEGSQEEFILISVSDQGSTGASGVAQNARDANGNIGLRINVTIAAVNNAPKLQVPPDFSALEDKPIFFSGLKVSDVDSGEKTTSSLAFEDWLGKMWNSKYLNKLRMTLQLEGYGNRKGRGFLYLNTDARDIFIVSNQWQTFVSIESLFPDHNTCKYWDKIRRPGLSECSALSIARLQGMRCQGDSDCNIVGFGNNSNGSTSSEMFLNSVDPIRDQMLEQVRGNQQNIGEFRFSVTAGYGEGQSGRIFDVKRNVDGTVVSLRLFSADEFTLVPNASSSWKINKVIGGGTCTYKGVDLQDICSFTETTPELAKLKLSSCEPPATCTCQVQDNCNADGKVLLFLNRSKVGLTDYFTDLTTMLSTEARTCGGLPVSREDYPLNFSLGKACTSNASCQDSVFPKCIPGETCKCCTNVSVTCSVNADCKFADNNFKNGGNYGNPLCGCTAGVEPPSVVVEKGTYCCARLNATCNKHSDCNKYLNNSFCGCVPGYPICGPFNDPVNGSLPQDPGYGQPCVYRGVEQTRFNTETLMDQTIMFLSNSCEGAMFSFEGTTNSKILNQLVFFQSDFEAGDLTTGSTRIEFYGDVVFCNIALKGLRYLTFNPEYPKYNRRFRIPVNERDPATFLIEANDFDNLILSVDDFGNSGGGARAPKRASAEFQIVVEAVNNPPVVHGPETIFVTEDVPYSILHDPATGHQGIYISDPDQINFGFNDPRIITIDRKEFSLGFTVNLTVQRGCLFLNEDFLRNGLEYAERGRTILGDPTCSLTRGFDLTPPGCTIRLKDYGQPRTGLHAYKCVDQFCSELDFQPCFSDDTTINKPHCFGRVCTKFLAFEGRFPDVNSVLKNVTYLGEPDFNTFYGYSENLKISISDNGLIGDALTTPSYSAELTIPIEVRPVNDAPRIGRLVDATCVRIKDDGQVLLNEPEKETRLFAINPVIDFVDVNEDTSFTFLPDRVWISDVDSEEADIRNTQVLSCAGECGSVRPAPEGCCRKDVCPELCNKINQAALGAQPSQVMVEFAVSYGLLSFYPPPTRTLLSGLEFLTNLTLTDIKAAGEVKPCNVQLSCMRNKTKVWLRGKMSVIQQALKWGFLTYQGAPEWHGDDSLSIWVSDDGYSDVAYTRPKTVSARIPLVVVPVNSPPTVQFPGGEGCVCKKASGICSCQSTPPLLYIKGEACGNDWMNFGIKDAWPVGRGLECDSLNESKVPNEKKQYAGFPVLSMPITFDDIDMNDTPNGNMTVEIVIGRKNAGDFTIRTIMQTVSYYQYVDDNEFSHIIIKGKIRDLNLQMGELYYNANDDYSGPAPFQISVSDNNNYGICTPQASNGRYQCNRAACRNFIGPSAMTENFVCGRPGINELRLTEFYEGASFSCRDIRQDPAPNNKVIVKMEGSWSGPFSCLGCGYYIESTRQVEDTPENNPSIPGLTRAIIDTVVGGASACEFENCSTCNQASKVDAGENADGCGWCPSFCRGQGKCMIGKYAPIFETCATHVDGRGYRDCRLPDSNIAIVIGTSLPLGLLGVVCIYLFTKWIQRRHGSLSVYMKKKKFDFQFTGRKLNLVPPAGANYNQFFYMIIVYLITGLFLSGVLNQPGGPFFFQQEIYLDAATSLQFDLDNCDVRFLPTRNFGFPTNVINAISLRFAYMPHPQVELVTDTCRPDSQFYLNNTRDPSLKYTNYYCTVQIITPENFVMPRIVINAIGQNLTTVRLGPMDADTRNFGIDFGSNEFLLSGDTMQARISNISAKHFKFDVLHGSLLATDIRYTLFGTFNTQDADIAITSETATSVRFWQKSENLVCLSAPSMFVDDNCEQVCDYVPQEGKSSSGTAVKRDPRYQYRVYRRSLNSTDDDEQGVGDDNTPGQDGGGQRRLLQSCDLVPGAAGYVPGCVNSDCTIDESALCTCKPTCDMVTPSELSFNGLSGVAGKCDADGKCCRRICGGHSLADLFPYANTVRCGICQDQNNCNLPTCGPWSNGKLDQQWWFTSINGQVSVSVQEPKSKPAQLHSYKGSVPNKDLSILPDFPPDEKTKLNEIFHPGGAKGPVDPWFWIRVSGPGAPPNSLGTYVWLRSIRYMVIPDYLLNIVSYSQLNPKKKAGSISLRPGFCPTFVEDDSPAMQKRIIEIYNLLSDTLQYYPTTEPQHPFEIGALLIWLAGSGKPSRFLLDKTNQISLSDITQFTGDGQALFSIFIISFIVPLTLATIVCVIGSAKLRVYMEDQRRIALLHENVILNVVMQAKIREMSEFDKIEAEAIPVSKVKEMRGRQTIWYNLEGAVSDPSEAKSFFREIYIVIGHLAVISFPTLYPWNLALMWKDAYQQYVCELRIDKDMCFATPEMASLIVFWAIFFFAMFSGFDLACYYLQLPFNKVRKFLRRAYYVVFGIFLWLTFSLIFINAFWIFLGTLQTPRKLGVYALAPVLELTIILKYFAKQRRFQSRLRHVVQERLKHFVAKMAQKKFSPKVLKILLDKNVENVLKASGVSTPTIILKCFVLAILISLINSYMFIGFQAFTDASSRDGAVLNASILLTVSFIILMAVQGDGDREWANDRIEFMADSVMDMMKKVVIAIEMQLKMANRMMASTLPAGYVEDEGDGSEETDYLLGGSKGSDGDKSGTEVAQIVK